MKLKSLGSMLMTLIKNDTSNDHVCVAKWMKAEAGVNKTCQAQQTLTHPVIGAATWRV